MATINLTAGNNNKTGTSTGDLFIGDAGGTDNLKGLDGNDRFRVDSWNNQRGVINGGDGIDRVIMIGHNNHTFEAGLRFVNVEELWADEPNLYARLSHLNAFSKFVPTGDGSFWNMNIEGPGGTLDLTGKYTATKRLEVDASNATSRVIVTGSARGDDFQGSDFSDVWIGGKGRDSATGNGGADIFRFKEVGHSTVANPDIIEDFDNGNDRVDVSQPFGPEMKFRGTAAFNGLGQVRLKDSGNDVIVQANVTGGRSADFAVKLLNIEPSELVKGDFIL